jgi:hypothetical protein
MTNTDDNTFSKESGALLAPAGDLAALAARVRTEFSEIAVPDPTARNQFSDLLAQLDRSAAELNTKLADNVAREDARRNAPEDSDSEPTDEDDNQDENTDSEVKAENTAPQGPDGKASTETSEAGEKAAHGQPPAPGELGEPAKPETTATKPAGGRRTTTR